MGAIFIRRMKIILYFKLLYGLIVSGMSTSIINVCTDNHVERLIAEGHSLPWRPGSTTPALMTPCGEMPAGVELLDAGDRPVMICATLASAHGIADKINDGFMITD